MVADRSLQKRWLRGFYEGTEGWRWTGRRFAVALDVPPTTNADAIPELDFSAPVELMNEVHCGSLQFARGAIRAFRALAGGRRGSGIAGDPGLSISIPPGWRTARAVSC